MNEQVEKLLVALMVLIDKQDGEIHLDLEDFQQMYDIRHKMGIQVHEHGEDGMILKLGEMTINPDEAQLN